MVKVGQYMCTTLYTTTPDTYAFEAIDEMYKNKISSLLVKVGEDYVGIITKTDWMFLILKGECDPKNVKVSTLMTKIENTIDENQSIATATAIIEKKRIRHIPVTRNGSLIGMLSVKDLEKYYLSLHKKTDF
jgi:signal-transduction protein with cAMP-binding, CBS, and nucleotidyltransferase domain